MSSWWIVTPSLGVLLTRSVGRVTRNGPVPGGSPGAQIAAGHAGKLTVVSGPNDGTVQVFTLGATGQLTAAGGAFG